MSKTRGQYPNRGWLMPLALRVFAASFLLVHPPFGAVAANSGLFSADKGAVVMRRAPQDLFREGRLAKEEWRENRHLGAVPHLSPVLRNRTARLDLHQLAEARRNVEAKRPASLMLNLFADAAFDTVLDRTEPTTTGYALTGRVEGEPLSMVVLVANNEMVEGTVWLPGTTHSISAKGAVAVIRQLAAPNLPHPRELATPNAEDTLQSAGVASSVGAVAFAVASASDSTIPADDGSIIDVLVVYPPITRQAQGGHRAMRTLIDHDIASTNEAYRVSGVRQRLALVGAFEVDFTNEDAKEAGQDGFYLLVGESDGYMDEVHALRDNYAADLVLFHSGDRGIGDFFAFYVNITNPMAYDAERYAFNPVNSNRIQFHFAHYLGHNMGLVHQRGVQPHTSGKFPYSHGYQLPKPLPPDPLRPPAVWYTIMAWGGERIPRFSNPNHRYPDESGAPLGVPGDEQSSRVDGPADAARSLNNTNRAVANFRRSAKRCAYDLSPEIQTVPTSGGEFKIRVSTAPGCAWMARSHDQFVSVTQGYEGVGNGEVTYYVETNNDWDREAAVLVAGEVFLLKQRGTRPLTPVCDRALAIQRALEETTGKSCANIAAADFASVGILDLYGLGLTALESGAFDGLSNLIQLDLRGNRITALLPNAFSGLSSLRTLYLSGNPLVELPPGVFDGLPRLHELRLNGIGLQTLRRGAFNGLSGLEALYLGDNNLTRLPPGVFESLPNLTNLGMWGNEFTKLEPDWFRGLSSLTWLNLGRAALKTIDPDAFNELTNLESLYLDHGELTAIGSGAFRELPNLVDLALEGNDQLTTIETGAFHGLSNLENLSLTDHQLKTLHPGLLGGLPNLRELNLSGDEYKVLPVGLFDGLHRLRSLYAGGRSLQSLQLGVFDGLSELRLLALVGPPALESGVFRGLSSLVTLKVCCHLGTLPPNLFNGLINLRKLDLINNPGAPFPLNLELVRLAGGAPLKGRSMEIAIRVREGAPFDMSVSLSASGGVTSLGEARVRAGWDRSDAISVTPKGNQSVIVNFDKVPSVPADPSCLNPAYWDDSDHHLCFLGIQTLADAPLTLYGFPNQTLMSHGSATLDLTSVFAYFLGAATYEVESSNPQVASASIADDLLTVVATGEGAAVLTVTATGGDGSRLERRFTVTVAPPVSNGMGGWRLWLLPTLVPAAPPHPAQPTIPETPPPG